MRSLDCFLQRRLLNQDRDPANRLRVARGAALQPLLPLLPLHLLHHLLAPQNQTRSPNRAQILFVLPGISLPTKHRKNAAVLPNANNIEAEVVLNQRGVTDIEKTVATRVVSGENGALARIVRVDLTGIKEGLEIPRGPRRKVNLNGVHEAHL